MARRVLGRVAKEIKAEVEEGFAGRVVQRVLGEVLGKVARGTKEIQRGGN